MTQPHSQPHSLTSTHARSHSVLSHATPSRSADPIAHPQPDQPSYSGSSTIAPFRSPCLMTDMWQWCIPQALHWWPRWSKFSRSFGASHALTSAPATFDVRLVVEFLIGRAPVLG